MKFNDYIDGGVFLVLGCFGSEQCGFVRCTSVFNYILRIDGEIDNEDILWEYFESLNLVNIPLCNSNSVRNTIYKMKSSYSRRCQDLWPQDYFSKMEEFMHFHKDCGLFLKLTTDPPYNFKIPSFDDIEIIRANACSEYKNTSNGRGRGR